MVTGHIVPGCVVHSPRVQSSLKSAVEVTPDCVVFRNCSLPILQKSVYDIRQTDHLIDPDTGSLRIHMAVNTALHIPSDQIDQISALPCETGRSACRLVQVGNGQNLFCCLR